MPPVLDNPAIWALTQKNAFLWVLVLTRMSGLMITMPLLGQERIPRTVRIAMVGLMTIIITPVVPRPVDMPQGAWSLAGFMACELFVGLILGTIVSWMIEMVALAGQILDMQMGFSFAQLIDPATSQSAAFSGTILIQCTLVFIVVSGLHHRMILALVESYNILPMGHAPPIRPMEMITLFSLILVKAFQLAMPVLLVLIFVNVLEGFAAKFMPQLQIIQLAFPLKIAVGLFVFGFMIQEFSTWLHPILERLPDWALRMLR
ncbi:MAG: flagellar biosynthetic protein FliR [Holophagales bacterium]|jgi:flagellar biosynthetic protein FliR|nr:flagellar biosynthetic protein FliR [Holophagales bacterium]